MHDASSNAIENTWFPVEVASLETARSPWMLYLAPPTSCNPWRIIYCGPFTFQDLGSVRLNLTMDLPTIVVISQAPWGPFEP